MVDVAADASTYGSTLRMIRRASRCKTTACGIAEAQLEQIFSTYFTTKSPERGTGLGLAVVRQIVESYGGSVSVTSEAGQGACFTVKLPLPTP